MTEYTHVIGSSDMFYDGERYYIGHRCETCDGLGEVFDRKHPGPNGAWPRIHCPDCGNYGLTFEPIE